VKAINAPNKVYRILALAMIVVGAALLILSVSSILNPPARCQDNLDRLYYDSQSSTPVGCVDPALELLGPSSNNFVILILSICLVAFGATILGMITRLESSKRGNALSHEL